MKPALMAHNTANKIYERQPPLAQKSQENVDSHPKPEDGAAEFNASKRNNTSHCLDMGVVCARPQYGQVAVSALGSGRACPATVMAFCSWC